MRKQGGGYSMSRRETAGAELVEVPVERSSFRSTVTDSCTACPAQRAQTRHVALTSASPTLAPQIDLQLVKASASEDTQHHSNWSRDVPPVVAALLFPAIGHLPIHQHYLAGR